MKEDIPTHPHDWEELSPLGDKWCKICGKHIGHFTTISKELWGLPKSEREGLMLLIRRYYARYKKNYLDKEV
jgi:hypothetical protein